MSNSFFIIEGSQVFYLNKPEIIIGRAPDCDFVVNDPRVSRKHAKVLEATATNNQVLITDMGSSGGTHVNGRPIVQKLLEPGDIVSLAGGFKMVFHNDLAQLPPHAKYYKPEIGSIQASHHTGMLDSDALPENNNQD